MSVYAIADLHLGFDQRVNKPMDIYGPQWENHTEKLKTEWEKTIGADDTMLIPGDISWALKLDEAIADLDWIHRLPGKKVLIRGNHELWWKSVSKLNRMYDNMYFLQNTFYPCEGTAICGSRGWLCPNEGGEFSASDEKIYKRELIRMELSLSAAKKAGYRDIIAMLHYPPTNDNRDPSGFTELFESYQVKTVIYGHLHRQEIFGKGLQGVRNGVEYHLVSFDYLEGKPKLIIE